MISQSNREVVLRRECRSDRHFREQVERRLMVASPRTRYWIRMKAGQPQALVLSTLVIQPNPSHDCTFEPAHDWLVLQ